MSEPPKPPATPFPLNAQGKPVIPNSPRPVMFFDQAMPFLPPDTPTVAAPPPGQPALSLIVMIYKMREQALKTLRSLALPYQQGVRSSDYEVIVVENASSSNLEEHEVTAFGPNFRYIRRNEPSPSPVPSVNFAASQARGAMIGLIIDGARMATPGLVSWTLVARRLHPDAIVATPGYHLGHKLQQDAMLEGYTPATEQQLLDSIGWPANGYRLFEIAVLSGTSANGIFKPIGESNCLSLPRHIWEKLGGCDPRFTETGGGQVNLDLYKRACELPETQVIFLLGEGTFHQFHGGITTGTRDEERLAIMAAHFAQYTAIRGQPYSAPLKRVIYLGAVPDCAQKFIQHSAVRVRQLRGELPDPHNRQAQKKQPPKAG